MFTKNKIGILPVSIESEMKQSYLDYAVSVIVSRALPDYRDGMKPVHRRTLYAMYNTGNHYNKPYRKSARVVGEVMGKYHPHGDAPIYSSLARMTQPFSLMQPLIDGQGNFGSIDGDSPAQMRYTEVRLARISDEGLLADIEKETVDFQDNYDGSEVEPKVLPARFPNLLVNGTSGIAVGMATSIPPHNLGEVIDSCCAYLENEQITAEEMLAYIPAPDFPTGGEIIGLERTRVAMLKGRGTILVRGKALVEKGTSRHSIIIYEIPYQVNKAELMKSIEELVKNKVLEGISEIRDETNKLGIRIVIELKRDTEGEVILNQLYKHTSLQTSISLNMLALNNGLPQIMNFRDIIGNFIKFREEIITKRTAFLLKKARDRAHILIGLLIALENINAMIPMIRSASDSNAAKSAILTATWFSNTTVNLILQINDNRNDVIDSNKTKLSEDQAKSILEMRLQRLTGLEKNKIEDELTELAEQISYYLSILGNREIMLTVIRNELLEIKDKFARPRHTQIIVDHNEFLEEDLIQREDMVVTITSSGYIKRTPLTSYREQNRGGRGKSAMSVHEDDTIIEAIVTNTHHTILFFSNIGRVYKTTVYKLPLCSLQSKGRALVNLFPLSENEKICNVLTIAEANANNNIIFATAKGNIRRNLLGDFHNIPSNGKIAIRIAENDSLIGVSLCHDIDHVMLATKQGKAVRFPVSELRVFRGRDSEGVRGVRLYLENDAVVSLAILAGINASHEIREAYLSCDTEQRLEVAFLLQQGLLEKANIIANKIANEKIDKDEILRLAQSEQLILAITSKGYGKKTSSYEYRVCGRGVQGVININLNEKNGLVVSTFPVSYDDSIVVITDKGVLIRTVVETIRTTSRNAMGVKVINLQSGDTVTSVSKVIENIKEESGNNDSNENKEISNIDSGDLVITNREENEILNQDNK